MKLFSELFTNSIFEYNFVLFISNQSLCYTVYMMKNVGFMSFKLHAYTVLHMFMQVLFWAKNHVNHQSFNPHE